MHLGSVSALQAILLPLTCTGPPRRHCPCPIFVQRQLARPCPQLQQDTGSPPATTGLGSPPATLAPGLGSPPATSTPGLGIICGGQWRRRACLPLSARGLPLLATALNLTLSASVTHAWYRATFPDYPGTRKRIVPFLL